jgi:hypothetical protein
MNTFVLNALLVFPTITLGWNGDGHRIIARIATHLVKPSTLGYLRTHLLGKGEPEFRLDAAITFASTWADSIVKDGSRRDTADYHFVNIDDLTKGTDRVCTPLRVACPARSCIVSAIEEFSTRASDSSLDKEERIEALKFVIHLVGDAHHPLHTGFASDRGGAMIDLLYPKTTLHHVWDDLLIDLVLDGKRWFDVASKIVENLKVQDVEQLSLPVPLSALDMVSNTILENTCSWAYQSRPGWWIKPNTVLPESYLGTRTIVAQKLLTQAGVRLGQYLDGMADAYYGERKTRRSKKRFSAFEEVGG